MGLASFSPMSFISEGCDNLESFSTNFKTEDQTSYFSEGIDFIINMNKEIESANKSLYIGIVESAGDQVVINESFSDFFDSIKKIIDKVIDFFKALFYKFIIAINRLFRSDKYLKKHKDDLLKFNSDHEFTITGREYTFIDNIPNNQVLYKANEILQTHLLSSSTQGAATTYSFRDDKTDIRNARDAFKDKLEDYMDEARGTIINTSPISSSDYAEELFITYRNGTRDKISIDVDSSVVDECYREFDNYHEVEKKVKKYKTDVEKAYKDVKRDLEAVSKDKTILKAPTGINGLDSNLDIGEDKKDVYDETNEFIKELSAYVSRISEVHIMAYTAKLDALKEKFNQDKKILYGALSRILGSIKDGVR